jgi:hypothetical protein
MTSLPLFPSPVPPSESSPSPSARPLSSLSTTPAPPDITPSIHSSTHPLFLLPATVSAHHHLTTPVLAISLEPPLQPPINRCPCPPAYHYTCLLLHPIACSIGNGLDLWPPTRSPTSPSLPSFLFSPLRMSAVPPTLHQQVPHSENIHTMHIDLTDPPVYMKRESSPSIFRFSSRTHRCSDGNLNPLPIHHHPILSGTSSGYLLPSVLGQV